MASFKALATFLVVTASGILPSSAQADTCTGNVTKVRKTINFDRFFITGGPTPPRPVTAPYVLETSRSPFVGFVYRPRDTFSTGFVGDVLFPNENGWRVFNCTHSFAQSPSALQKEGCTSGDLALHLPKPSSADLGTIGSLVPITYPQRSPWAVYDLHGFRITPDEDREKIEGKHLVLQVEAWNDEGRRVGKHVERFKGGKAGYEITIPDGGWRRVIRWQINLALSDGRARYGFYLDDVKITEYEYEPGCEVPNAGYGPTPPTQKLPSNDLPLDGPVPPVYRGFELTGNWSAKPWPAGPHKSPALYGLASNEQIPSLVTSSTTFDAFSFTISVDTSTLPANTTADSIVIYALGNPPCTNSGSQGRRQFRLSSLTQKIDIPSTFGEDQSGGSFEKIMELRLGVRYWPDPNQYEWWEAPFWVKDIEYRYWRKGGRDGRGPFLPGCFRCLKYLLSWCEWPRLSRTPLPV